MRYFLKKKKRNFKKSIKSLMYAAFWVLSVAIGHRPNHGKCFVFILLLRNLLFHYEFLQKKIKNKIKLFFVEKNII
jgi:hypothetical protein